MYAKAVAAVAGAVVAIAAVFGTNIDPEIVTTVVSLVTAALVYVIPNADA